MIKLLTKLKGLALPLLTLMCVALTFGGVTSSNSSKGTNGTLKANSDYIILSYNNMIMPLDNRGVLADVNTRGGRTQDNKIFLFSGGFFMSGIANGKTFGNGVMSASRIYDYVPGPVGSSETDSKNQIYLVTAQDPVFGQAWQDWKDAVSQGADFYDGDHDGVYDPVDKNGNGIWDADEDRPDLIGDFTAWCVYNDGKAKALRTYTDVDPQGIEIRQTVFGFQSKGLIGDMLFVRYRIVNTGTVADVMDSVYFSVACDPDLGDYTDDLVGCDTTLSCAFTYNNGPDKTYGTNPPCFMVDFFQGPYSYIPGVTFTDKNGNGVYDEGIDVPLKYATNVRGKVLGTDSVNGAMNLPLTSFTQYMQSHPTHGDPQTQYEVRNYLIGGLGKDGVPIDPCKWAFGNGSSLSDCAQIDPKFMYSGDPVSGLGWLNTTPQDQRQMSNTGPFRLEKNKPLDIVVAYIIGQGSSALNSVTVAKTNDKTAQNIFNANFPSPTPPTPVDPEVVTGDGFIDLNFSTNKQVSYHVTDTVLQIDRRFQGFYVTAYATQSQASTINGVQNSALIATYDLKDSINNLYQVQANGGIDLKIAEGPAEHKLDTSIYAYPSTGRIKLRITKDPISGGPLVKGKEYYFVVTAYTLNHNFIYNMNSRSGSKENDGRKGDYCDYSGSGIDQFDSKMVRCVYGTNEYLPSNAGITGSKSGGVAQGKVKFLVADNSKLTGDEYSVEFFRDTKGSRDSAYSAMWRLKNKTKGTLLLDSCNVFNYDTADYSGKVYEGIIPRVQYVLPAIGTGQYVSATGAQNWFVDSLNVFFYLGSDIIAAAPYATKTGITIPGSKVTMADRMRKVEIRFGTPGKAYRYLQGFQGASYTKPNNFVYAGSVTAADTVGLGPVGMLGQGFVDVPFTAWIKDDKFNVEQQLTVGFIERSQAAKGNPDGIWNPLDSIINTHEYIIVFDSPYDPTGSQIQYTGGTFNKSDGSTTTVWANLSKGFTIPSNATGVTADQINTASSPWFNGLYLFGIQRKTPTSTYGNGDKYVISVKTYPYAEGDAYTAKPLAKGIPTTDSQKDLFNKVNVFPNPLFAYNPGTSYTANTYPDDPFVTFSNLPTEITVKIYTLSGTLIRTLTQNDKADGTTSPFLRWNLKNESGLRVASGMYIAIVSSPKFGDKILKFGIVMPQKQIRNY